MSNYNTGNPVPSIDPRDLDDNATVFDQLVQSSAPSIPDRLGVARKTWWQMEQDAAALLSPNVSALAGLTGAADLGFYFTGAGAMSTYTLSSAGRTLATAVDATAQEAALPWAAPLASPTFTGTPLSTTPAVGTNTTQIATAAMFQAEIANHRVWTAYTPTVTANVNTFTSASATGKHMAMFGICFLEIVITITTKGTGSDPKVTLPLNALSGSAGHVLPCREELVNGLSGSAIILAGLNQLQVTTSTNSNMATANGCVIKIQGFYPLA